MKFTYNQHQKAALLKKLLARMDRMLRSNGFQALKAYQRRSFVHRLRRLTRQLKPDFSRMGLRPAVLTALTTLGLGVMTQGKAQFFDSTQVLPFNITALPESEAKPTLVDIDADGDLDMFIGSEYGNIYYSENIGTATAPSFGTLQTNPFNITPANYYSVPELIDIDNDGDLDLFIGEAYPIALKYAENIGTSTAPMFDSLQVNPFGITIGVISDYELKPAIADLDGDGDFDILAGTAYGSVIYFQNTGTATAPAFGAYVNSPFGIVSPGYYLETSFVDLDADGDQDLGICDYYGTFTYLENTGTTTAPAFATGQGNPFNIATISTYLSFWGAAFVDLDGDLDFDMVKGVGDGEIWYQENVDTSSVVNQPPVIVLSQLADTTCVTDTLGPIAFTAEDIDSPNYSVTLSSTNQVVIADADITLTGTSPNYMFSAVPSFPGFTDIVVTAADSNSVVTDTVTVYVDPCLVGIDNSFFAREFSVYPNPADRELAYRLDLLSPVSHLELELVDLNGRVILSEQRSELGTEFTGQLDVSELSAGIYFLQVRSELYRLNQKVVIE